MSKMWDEDFLITSYRKSVRSWRKKENFRFEEEKENFNNENVNKERVKNIGGGCPGVTFDIDFSKFTNTKGSDDDIWEIGSPCRSRYSEDGLDYEAKIVAIQGSLCTVRFVGYRNEEQVSLSELKTTHGKKVRDEQRRQARAYQLQTDLSLADRVSNISLTSSMNNNYSESFFRDDYDYHVNPDQEISASSPPSDEDAEDEASPGGCGKGQSSPPSRPPHFPPLHQHQHHQSQKQIQAQNQGKSQNLQNQQQRPLLQQQRQQQPQQNDPNLPYPMVPPMPQSVLGSAGTPNFARGELPSLLMSWYMAGYQSGYFDAKHENPNRHK